MHTHTYIYSLLRTGQIIAQKQTPLTYQAFIIIIVLTPLQFMTLHEMKKRKFS